MSFTPTASKELNGPGWLQDRRARSALSLDLPQPSPQQEIWRYSRVGDIDLTRYAPVVAQPESAIVPTVESELVAAIGAACATVTAVDGHIVHIAKSDDLPQSVEIGAGSGDWDSVAGTPTDLFEARNGAFMPSPVQVRIPAGVVVPTPILVVHRAATRGGFSCPRTVVLAADTSQATIVELFVSDDVEALVAPVTELSVGAAANLTHIAVQVHGPKVDHIGYSVSSVERDGQLTSTTVALGGSYSRVRTETRLVGKGANSVLRAAYFGTDNQMHDFRTLQKHSAPKTTSDLFFKGAAGNEAHSVYSGLIQVENGAAGTNAFQTNRNLILSSAARAESVPNLEIEENDVKCSHASAVGPIDEMHRYYLESRGVPADVASRLISIGFLDEVLSTLSLNDLRRALRSRIVEKLDGVEDLVATNV